MKVIAIGAAMLASVLFSKYEFAVSPDMHFGSMSNVGCDFIASDPEFSGDEFERLLCELSQDVPFDSVSCFMSSIKLRMKNSDEPELAAGENKGDQT